MPRFIYSYLILFQYYMGKVHDKILLEILYLFLCVNDILIIYDNKSISDIIFREIQYEN